MAMSFLNFVSIIVDITSFLLFSSCFLSCSKNLEEDPHPAIVAIGDKKGSIRVLLYSCYTAITEGVPSNIFLLRVGEPNVFGSAMFFPPLPGLECQMSFFCHILVPHIVYWA